MKKTLTFTMILMLVLSTVSMLATFVYAEPGDPTILDVGITFEDYSVTLPGPISASVGGHLRLWYYINNPNPTPLSLILGATIRDSVGGEINDPANDKTVSVDPGGFWYSRFFYIPSNAKLDTYDVAYGIWKTDWSVRYDIVWKTDWLTVTDLVPLSLSSLTTNGFSNVGTITFDGVTYTLPRTIYVATRTHWSGTDDIHATPPSGYIFDHWESSGQVSISDQGNGYANVYVHGSGGIKAVFRSEPTFDMLVYPLWLGLLPGGTSFATITLVSQNDFSGYVDLALYWPEGRPEWVVQETFTPDPVYVPSGGTATSTLTIEVSETAPTGSSESQSMEDGSISPMIIVPPGWYFATIVGTSNSLSKSVDIDLILPPDFYLLVDPWSVAFGEYITIYGEMYPSPRPQENFLLDIYYTKPDGSTIHRSKIVPTSTEWISEIGEPWLVFEVDMFQPDMAGTWTVYAECFGIQSYTETFEVAGEIGGPPDPARYTPAIWISELESKYPRMQGYPSVYVYGPIQNPTNPSNWIIEYWYYFPYDDPSPAGEYKYDDWEPVFVEVDSDDSVVGVYTTFHYFWRSIDWKIGGLEPRDYPICTEGTHPIVVFFHGFHAPFQPTSSQFLGFFKEIGHSYVPTPLDISKVENEMGLNPLYEHDILNPFDRGLELEHPTDWLKWGFEFSVKQLIKAVAGKVFGFWGALGAGLLLGGPTPDRLTETRLYIGQTPTELTAPLFKYYEINVGDPLYYAIDLYLFDENGPFVYFEIDYNDALLPIWLLGQGETIYYEELQPEGGVFWPGEYQIRPEMPLFFTSPGYYRLKVNFNGWTGSIYNDWIVIHVKENPAQSYTVISLKETQAKLFLHLYDAENRHVGLNYDMGIVEVAILGAYYFDFNESEIIITLPANISNFKIVVDAGYAEEFTETYNLTVTRVSNFEVCNSTTIFSTIQQGLLQEYRVLVPPEGPPIFDNVPPTTQLIVDTPKHVTDSYVFVSGSTRFTLVTTDNENGSGVKETAYRICNSTFDTGWIVFEEPFYLSNLADGIYTMTFNSTDNVGNIEIANVVMVGVDNAAPSTDLTIGEPKYVTTGFTYVTSETPFALSASDAAGSGVAFTFYKIFNSSYDSGWLTYISQFYLIELADGNYTIAFYSVDNIGNTEAIKSIQVTLFSWTYIFTDSYGRGTMLKINTAHKLFQFIAPDKTFPVEQDPKMYIYKYLIAINYKDGEIRLYTIAIDTRIGFCSAYAKDMQTGKTYWLIDKPN